MLHMAHTFVCAFSPFPLNTNNLSCWQPCMHVGYFANFQ
ncbi:hypothetical protein M106_4148 [Bacteroides fragilis str. 1009-4-F |nr:hypothetical protein M106_4148 [Bacteroides fragilis str. 1009-4-F \